MYSFCSCLSTFFTYNIFSFCRKFTRRIMKNPEVSASTTVTHQSSRWILFSKNSLMWVFYLSFYFLHFFIDLFCHTFCWYIYILFPLLLRHTIKTSIRMRCRATISAAMKTSTCSIARKLRDSRARQVNSLFPLLYLLFYCAKSQSLIWFLLLAFFYLTAKLQSWVWRHQDEMLLPSNHHARIRSRQEACAV